MWISKEDVGVESKTEKEKGQASDAFKRAGFNWNIGRELYTAPFIWVNFTDDEKMGAFAKFSVRDIEYDSKRNISYLLITDNKGKARYEFGKKNGVIYLMDEIHTPDSSRYFYAEGYEERLAAGEKQKQLSKEFVREWLMANGFQGQEGQQVPEMTDEIVSGITERYVELYENIVGEKFEKAEGNHILARIEKNVTECLASL